MPPFRRKVLEEEMTDIFEGGYLCVGKGTFFDNVVKDNIKEILRRRGILREGMDVVIPPGALSDLNCDDNFYQYDFQVMDRHGNIVYAGTAYGTATCSRQKFRRTGDPCDIFAEIVDMEVELYR